MWNKCFGKSRWAAVTPPNCGFQLKWKSGVTCLGPHSQGWSIVPQFSVSTVLPWPAGPVPLTWWQKTPLPLEYSLPHPAGPGAPSWPTSSCRRPRSSCPSRPTLPTPCSHKELCALPASRQRRDPLIAMEVFLICVLVPKTFLFNNRELEVKGLKWKYGRETDSGVGYTTFWMCIRLLNYTPQNS